jgi:hypothetical protein
MSESHCPICFAQLEVRDVAPCFDCGSDPTELDHLAEGKHTYAEVLAFGVPIVLCKFCLVDFSSYDAAYFNRPRRTKLGLGEFVEVRAITNPSRGKDKFWVCRRRLAFLRCLAKVRAAGSDDDERRKISG